MGFDDYSYRLFNDQLLKPKSIKTPNDDDVEKELRTLGVEDEHLLTQENMREFDSSH